MHADMPPIRRAIKTHAKAFGIAADDDLIRTALLLRQLAMPNALRDFGRRSNAFT
jgi:hypothetical protein